MPIFAPLSPARPPPARTQRRRADRPRPYKPLLTRECPRQPPRRGGSRSVQRLFIRPLSSRTARRHATLSCVLSLCAFALLNCFPQSEAAAQERSAAAGELYLFNDSGRTLIPSNQVVTDNGRVLASLARQTYVRLPLAPGEHLLRPDPYLWKQEVRLQVTPGSTHYVVVAYKPERSWALPLAGPPLLLHQLNQHQAEPLLREMKAQ